MHYSESYYFVFQNIIFISLEIEETFSILKDDLE